jgi:hypothetical protein
LKQAGGTPFHRDRRDDEGVYHVLNQPDRASLAAM